MKKITCACHGESDYALICIHLAELEEGANPVKYYWGESEPDDESRSQVENVWCEACDQILLRENEWNDVSEGHANIQVVCIECLEVIKSQNIPGLS